MRRSWTRSSRSPAFILVEAAGLPPLGDRHGDRVFANDASAPGGNDGRARIEADSDHAGEAAVAVRDARMDGQPGREAETTDGGDAAGLAADHDAVSMERVQGLSQKRFVPP